MRDLILGLFQCIHPFDLAGDLAVLYLRVRRLQEPEFIDAGIIGEMVHQTDGLTFRSFNRTNAAIVGRVYVAHFKTGVFTRQTARSKQRQASLVLYFRQRVYLVHKL